MSESVMDTRVTEDQGKSRSAKPTLTHSQVDEESTCFEGHHGTLYNEGDGQSKTKFNKGTWQPAPIALDISQYATEERIEMSQIGESEEHDEAEMPALKHASADAQHDYDFHAPGILPKRAPSTAGSDSPIIGYAR
jgi:hypothetical protein